MKFALKKNILFVFTILGLPAMACAQTVVKQQLITPKVQSGDGWTVDGGNEGALAPFVVTCSLDYHSTTGSAHLRATTVDRTCVTGIRLSNANSATYHAVSCVIPAGRFDCQTTVTPIAQWGALRPTAAFTAPMYSAVEESAGCLYSFPLFAQNAASETYPQANIQTNPVTGVFSGISVLHRFVCARLPALG